MPAARFRCAQRSAGAEPVRGADLLQSRRSRDDRSADGANRIGISACSVRSADTERSGFSDPALWHDATAEQRNPAFRNAGPGALLRGTAPRGITALDLDGVKIPVAPDGAFLLGFNRDAPVLGILTVTLADGQTMAEPLTVEPRAWRREFVAVAARGGMPSEAFLARRRPELEMIEAARQIQSDSAGWRQQFIWPATGRVSGIFGSQRIYAGEPGSFHSGVDVAGAVGTPVVAPADGVVILAAPTPFRSRAIC